MPTKQKRVNFIVSEKLDLALDRLSKATGRSRSALVAYLLDQTVPQLHLTAQAIEEANKTPTHAMSLLMTAGAQALAQGGKIVGEIGEVHRALEERERRNRADD